MQPPTAPKPRQVDVMRAVETYMRFAYEGGEVPLTVRSHLAVLRNWKGDFYRTPVIATDKADPPKRLTIRLGNRGYPHMKLAMELSPDERTYLFRADTHDGHCLPPPDAPEYAEFQRIMAENQKIAVAIENAWAAEGLPTFKTFLRDDLAKRQAGERGE